MKRTLILVLTVLSMAGCHDNILRQRDVSPRANFDALWQILDQRYCYFNERNIDWQGVSRELSPAADTVRDVYELYRLLEQMVDTLHDGHVNLLTPLAVSASEAWYDTFPVDYYASLLSSDAYLGTDALSLNSLTYDTIGPIGYLRVSSFSGSISPSTLSYISYYFRNTVGLVLDVRNNGGGSLAQSAALAASFFTERTLTGYIRHKTGPGHSDFSEPEPLYTDPADWLVDWSSRPVAVLLNRRSYSATNDFVVRMKQAPHAVLIGGLSGGGGGMPLSEELPSGWMVRFSAVPMYDAEMQTTEFGVRPDIEVHITAADLAEGRDAILDRAIEWLNHEIRKEQ